MNRIDFDGMEVHEQIRYVNNKSKEGHSITKICKDIGIGRTTVRDRFKAAGYFLNSDEPKQYVYFLNSDEPKQYVKDDDNHIVVIKESNAIKKAAANNNDNNRIEVIEEIALTKMNNDNSMTLVIDDKLKNDLIGLAENYDKLMALIEQYNKKYDKECDWIGIDSPSEKCNHIKIELPFETVKDFRTTIRVNNVAWDQFKEFCNNHKEFTQRDLLSQALIEYMHKYK